MDKGRWTCPTCRDLGADCQRGPSQAQRVVVIVSLVALVATVIALQVRPPRRVLPRPSLLSSPAREACNDAARDCGHKALRDVDPVKLDAHDEEFCGYSAFRHEDGSVTPAVCANAKIVKASERYDLLRAARPK